MIQGLITGILLITFVGGWIWLYGKSRKPALDAAARIPLEDDVMAVTPVARSNSKDRP